ncbi:aldo/keto reductase [Pseudomonas sp. R5(2019)]|uniref:aldo/keto reductase n=1 Tax=Pseudomonas sp. R5(2019) TaxID=2697566 RepID=UPI0014123493|nr:aldo/keto reductase [Pseudomonas sp. R5(2019)]NBA96617.1 aldo/keto reductase [Pseudomonas sp. R5(2019)]
MKTTTIGNTGVALSSLGLGTVPLAGFGGDCTYDQAEKVVLAAYESGIRYFDAAPMYGSGLAELRLGQIVRENRLRDSITLSTKVGRLLKPKSRLNAALAEPEVAIQWKGAPPLIQEYDYSYDGVMRSFEDSCQRFGLDSFEILYIHDIGRVTHDESANSRYWQQLRMGGLKALDELRRSGAAKAIGIGVNETAAVLEMAGEFNLDCCLLAGRYSLLNHGALTDFFPEMQKRHIAVIAAGVFNSGILGGGATGMTRTFEYMEAPPEIIERVMRIESICRHYDVALPQAAVQFVYAHPAVSCVLQGCKSTAEVQQNGAAIQQPTPAAMWQELAEAGLIPAHAPRPVFAQ